MRFSDARIARVPISVPSGSGQPTVGLSWVSVLKSAGKQAATPLTAATVPLLDMLPNPGHYK